MKSQTVADIVQAQRMTQLGENHGYDMARRRKTPRLNFVLVLQFFDKFFGMCLTICPSTTILCS